ncbi:MAG: hypothetical protein RJB01_1289 [Actinomycetota bacterium]
MSAQSAPTPSLWWDTLPEGLRQPLGAQLTADHQVDVCLVGAGYSGLWTAYHLTNSAPNLRIGIVDAHFAGYGASGRNGGWASALFPISTHSMAGAYGHDRARAMKRAMIDSVSDLGMTISAHGWDAQFAHGGTIVSARTKLQLQQAEADVANELAEGFNDLTLLTSEQARAVMNATDTLGGTYTPNCAALNPARLVRELATTVAERGVQFFEYSPVRHIEPGAVRCSRGTIRAQQIIRATEGYTPSLKGQSRVLAPIYSLMLATEPLPTSVWEEIGLSRRETFADGRHLIIYGQRTFDDRIAFGGRGAPYHFRSRVDPRFDQNPRVHAALWSALVDLFPVVRDYQVEYTWGGVLGVARDWWASCGLDDHTGLGWLGGYVGDGVTSSFLAGATVADLLLHQDTDRTHLPWVNHESPRWEPEPFRWIGASAALAVMTKADGWEQRTGRPSRMARAVSRLTGH